MQRFFYSFATAIGLFGLVISWPLLPLRAQTTNQTVPDNYIVLLNDQATTNPTAILGAHQIIAHQTFSHALNGFAGSLTASQITDLQHDPRVKAIVPDHYVNATITRQSSILTTPVRATTRQAASQTVSTGLNRTGINATNKGTGIGVAVLDTGIDLQHPDLATNIVADTSCLANQTRGNDDNGHGSHIAGIIAAANNNLGVLGVAPEAKLVAIKVLDRNGIGTWSSVICGIDWATAHAAQYNIKVANLSLAGPGTSDNNCGKTNNDPLHQAICQSTAAGITYVVAAGNSNADASNSVPASYKDSVISVSALADSDGQPGGLGVRTAYGADDTFASFSDFGSVIDLGAPGVNIRSTWINNGYASESGTSMAAPFVSGCAALYLKNHPTAGWSEVRQNLIQAAETVGNGHSDPSGHHSEPVVRCSQF